MTLLDWVNLGQIHSLGSFSHTKAGASKRLFGSATKAISWHHPTGGRTSGCNTGLTNGEDDIRADLGDATAEGGVMRCDEARPQFASGAARYLTTPEKIKVRFESWTQEALNDA